jgi:ribosomal protein L29
MPKHSTYKDSSDLEITQSLNTAQKELSETRLGIRTQKIKTHALIRKNRKSIARMHTALRERQLSAATRPIKEKTDGK